MSDEHPVDELRKLDPASLRVALLDGTTVPVAVPDIVRELVRRNRSDAWIAKELGMEQDEVLRLKQLTGLAELFASREFSEAWESEE